MVKRAVHAGSVENGSGNVTYLSFWCADSERSPGAPVPEGTSGLAPAPMTTTLGTSCFISTHGMRWLGTPAGTQLMVHCCGTHIVHDDKSNNLSHWLPMIFAWKKSWSPLNIGCQVLYGFFFQVYLLIREHKIEREYHGSTMEINVVVKSASDMDMHTIGRQPCASWEKIHTLVPTYSSLPPKIIFTNFLCFPFLLFSSLFLCLNY